MPNIIGTNAPEWSAEAYWAGEIKNISLSDFKGKWIVFFFYPRDFTFICPTELKGFAQAEADFSAINTVVVGASTDSVFSHKAWFERDLPNVKYPVIADTSLSIARSYGALIEESGTAVRATYIIDPDGKVRYALMSDLGVGRSVDETIRVMKALQTGELCPVEWKPGESTLGKA